MLEVEVDDRTSSRSPFRSTNSTRASFALDESLEGTRDAARLTGTTHRIGHWVSPQSLIIETVVRHPPFEPVRLAS